MNFKISGGFLTVIALIHVPSHTAEANFRAYALKTDDCNLEINAKKNGNIYLYNSAENTLLFAEESNAKGARLEFHFKCRQENAKTYCPTTWTEPLKDTDPITLKAIKVRRYDFRHPRYYSLAFAASANAVNPPRPRTLEFCLGDSNTTVEGRVDIGTERHQTPLQALKIINTLVIHPADPPVKSPPSAESPSAASPPPAPGR